MSIYYVDAHCHLDLIDKIQLNPSLENNPEIKSISVTNAPSFFVHNEKLFTGMSNIRIALGLHPELVNKYFHEVDQFKLLINNTKYIGEIGLDGSKQHVGNYQQQKKIFEEILILVHDSGNKILTIHSRNSANDVIELLSKYIPASNSKVILHWYSGDLTSLKKAIDLGYYFSINHKMVLTANGQTIIRAIPQTQILTETDAPFTFGQGVNTRLKSLENTLNGLSQIYKMEFNAIKSLVFDNFKRILS